MVGVVRVGVSFGDESSGLRPQSLWSSVNRDLSLALSDLLSYGLLNKNNQEKNSLSTY